MDVKTVHLTREATISSSTEVSDSAVGLSKTGIGRINEDRTRIRPGRQRLLIVLGSILAAALAFTAGLYYLSYRQSGHFSPSLPLVGKVTAVNFDFSGASNCWTMLTGPGFGWPNGGAVFTVGQLLSYGGGSGEPSSCSVRAVSIMTLGFTLNRSNVPFVVQQGTVASLNVTVETPPSSYFGPLNLTVTVTSP